MIHVGPQAIAHTKQTKLHLQGVHKIKALVFARGRSVARASLMDRRMIVAPPRTSTRSPARRTVRYRYHRRRSVQAIDRSTKRLPCQPCLLCIKSAFSQTRCFGSMLLVALHDFALSRLLLANGLAGRGLRGRIQASAATNLGNCPSASPSQLKSWTAPTSKVSPRMCKCFDTTSALGYVRLPFSRNLRQSCSTQSNSIKITVIRSHTPGTNSLSPCPTRRC